MYKAPLFPSLTMLAAAAALLTGCATTQPPRQSSAIGSGLVPLHASAAGASERAMTQLLRAEFALTHQDMPTALRAYAQAAALTGDPRVAATSARLASHQGDAAAARTAIERMQATGADDETLARERARLALLNGHRDEARQQLRKMLAPGDAQAWADFAGVLSDARDPALAGVLLEDLATADTLPDDEPSVWLAMSQLGEKLHRFAYAEHLAIEAAERFDSAVAWAWAAHLKLEAGAPERAFALYAKAVAADPDNASLRQTYAAALGEAGRDREALQVLQAGPETLQVLTGRAAYAARLEDTAELARVYAILKDHRASYDRDIAFLLGRLAESTEQLQEALAWYGDVAPGSRHGFDAAIRRVVLKYRLDQGEQAHQLAQALQRDHAGEPDKLERAYLLGAQLYQRAQQPDKALAVYNRGLEVLPDSTPLLYGRALTRADSGHIKGAIADLRRVLQLDPDDVDAMNALGYTLADENRDLAEAEQLLSEAMSRQPDAAAIIDSWGWLKYRQGELQEAAESLRRAWDLRKDTDIGLHLGEVLWQLGRHDQARQVFDAVRAMAPDSAALARTLERLQP